MKKLYVLTAVAFTPACATVGKLLPGGEEQAVEMGDTIMASAPALAEQGGMVTTMLTGNPELGGAVTALLTGAAGLFAAKKIKEKKAAKAVAPAPVEEVEA
jgi:hypothetical protein|tara:strand:- start:436 stop:738 length:303 start_codon:yes stop_codon:yes gene_type:complete